MWKTIIEFFVPLPSLCEICFFSLLSPSSFFSFSGYLLAYVNACLLACAFRSMYHIRVLFAFAMFRMHAIAPNSVASLSRCARNFYITKDKRCRKKRIIIFGVGRRGMARFTHTYTFKELILSSNDSNEWTMKWSISTRADWSTQSIATVAAKHKQSVHWIRQRLGSQPYILLTVRWKMDTLQEARAQRLCYAAVAVSGQKWMKAGDRHWGEEKFYESIG